MSLLNANQIAGSLYEIGRQAGVGGRDALQSQSVLSCCRENLRVTPYDWTGYHRGSIASNTSAGAHLGT
jgi:hypothetical protein